jgi:hypothetical protein
LARRPMFWWWFAVCGLLGGSWGYVVFDLLTEG